MTLIHLITAVTIDNPLDGILPDFSVFGTEFNALWKKVLGGLWAIGLVVAVAFLMRGLTMMGKADDGNPQMYKQGRKAAMNAGIALAGLAALTVIVGAILFFVG